MEQDQNQQVSTGRMLIPAMVVGFVSIAISNALLSFFSRDIAVTFKVPIAVVLQLSTINFAGMFIFSLLMGALAVRVNLRHLLLAGAVFVVVSAVGNFMAKDFLTMTFFFLIEGIGSVIFFVMGVTLFGNVYLPDRRAKALSYTMSAGWATALFGPTVNVLIANAIGWQWNFLLWVLPWMLVGLILSYFAVPKSSATTAVVEKVSIGGAFKSVLKNRSATAILAANILAIAGVEVGVFAIPFYRYPNGFNFSLTSALGWVTVVAAIFVIFIVVGGRLVNRFGAKPMAVICTLLTGVFTMIFFFIPYLPLTLFFDSLHCVFAAMALPAYACLALAQVPKSRGTMMALNQAMDNVGKMMAPFIGGLILSATIAVYGLEVYGFVGLMLGGLSIAASAVLFLWAKDPTKA